MHIWSVGCCRNPEKELCILRIICNPVSSNELLLCSLANCDPHSSRFAKNYLKETWVFPGRKLKIRNMSLRPRTFQEGSVMLCKTWAGEGFSAVEGNREETSVGMPLQRAALSLARPGSQGLNTLVTPKTFGVDKQALAGSEKTNSKGSQSEYWWQI